MATQHHIQLSQPDFCFPSPLRLLQLNYLVSSWAASVQQESSAHRKAWETDCFLTRGCFCQHINQPLRGKVVLVQGRVPQLERTDNCSKHGWGKQGAGKIHEPRTLQFWKSQRAFCDSVTSSTDNSTGNFRPYPGCVIQLQKMGIMRCRILQTQHKDPTGD